MAVKKKQVGSTQSGSNDIRTAVSKGDLDLVKKLLDAGTNMDKTDTNGLTPLHMAVSEGRIDAVKLLLEAGADVNHIDSKGISPLIQAALRGAKSSVETPPVESPAPEVGRKLKERASKKAYPDRKQESSEPGKPKA